jgi:hypothetical protein
MKTSWNNKYMKKKWGEEKEDDIRSNEEKVEEWVFDIDI